MSRTTNQQATSAGIAANDKVCEFLSRELPIQRAAYFAEAVREAGKRYDRLIGHKDDWRNFSSRRSKLLKITRFIEGLTSGLDDLDILSREDLAGRTRSDEVDVLAASLRRLQKEVAVLIQQTQKVGRPRDIAEQRWVLELAGIYENAFGRTATVWGAGGPARGRSAFYQFLKVSRPEKLPIHGKLHVRQVDRILKARLQHAG